MNLCTEGQGAPENGLPGLLWPGPALTPAGRRGALGSSENHGMPELNGTSDIMKCPRVTCRDTEAQDGWGLVEVLYIAVESGPYRIPSVTIK